MKRSGKTNFDRYLNEQLEDAGFRDRFERAGEAWDMAMKLAALRKEAGLSQKELAQKGGTSQQQISRLESPSYEGHSLSILRRIAAVLGATVHMDIKRINASSQAAVPEATHVYCKIMMPVPPLSMRQVFQSLPVHPLF